MRNLMNSVERIRWLLVLLAVALFVSCGDGDPGTGPGDQPIEMPITGTAVNAVTTWPTHGLFGQFP